MNELSLYLDRLYVDSEYRLRWKNGHRKDLLAGSLNVDGYIQISIGGTNKYAHRILFAIYNKLDTLDESIRLDHIDGDKRNNRPDNLRISTVSENAMNRGKQANNSSGHKGVSYRRDRNRWLAKITKDGKAYHIGLFKSKEEAAIAYRQAASEVHGEFSRS